MNDTSDMVTLGILITALFAWLLLHLISEAREKAIDHEQALTYLLIQMRFAAVTVASLIIATIFQFVIAQQVDITNRDLMHAVSMVFAWFPAAVFGVLYTFLQVYGMAILEPRQIHRSSPKFAVNSIQ